MGLLPLLGWLEMVENEGGGENAVEKLNGVDPFDDLVLGVRLQRHDQLAGLSAAMNLGALDRTKRLKNRLDPVGAAVNDKTGDVALGVHETLSMLERLMALAGQAREQSPQPVQASVMILGRAPPRASSKRTAPVGHASRQLMQAIP